MSLIRKHGAVLQAWACLALVNTDDAVAVCKALQTASLMAIVNVCAV